MSVVLNAKGTSSPFFSIGKQGVTLYQGINDPSLMYAVKPGDLWLGGSDNSIKIREVSNLWGAPNLGGVSFNDGTITTDSGVNLEIVPSGKLILADNLGIGTAPTGRNNASIELRAGIAFPEVEQMSSDPRVLDDYEEGNFIPYVMGTDTVGTAVYTTQVGRYQKIGNRVTVSAAVEYTGHTGTGSLLFAGIPFAHANLQAGTAMTHWFSGLQYFGTNVCSFLPPAATGVRFQSTGSGSPTADLAMVTAGAITISGTYEVN